MKGVYVTREIKNVAAVEYNLSAYKDDCALAYARVVQVYFSVRTKNRFQFEP
jgi:hypothetical protein